MEKSKFNKFEANKLQSQFHILGGAPQASTYRSSDGTSGADIVDFETYEQTNQSGFQWDYRRASQNVAS